MPAMIVLGDKTDHGGEVISASGVTDTYGKCIARVGDMVTCPKKGHGTCEIVTGDHTMIIDGKPVARHGDKTACGATLIASQSLTTTEDGGGWGGGSDSSDRSATAAERRAAIAESNLQIASHYQPPQTLEVRIVDADEQSPSAEPLTLVDGNGTEHEVTAGTVPTQLNDFKPGAARIQPRRTADSA